MIALLFAGLAMLFATPAKAASPGADALQELREGTSRPGAIQNRFFVKVERWELTPMFGYVPNNPFAKRFVGGVMLAHHFSEALAVEGALTYSPDLGENDLKGLTSTLVYIAREATEEFQQPLDKTTLSASFSCRWAPLYGKINLIGEKVLNFDTYLVGGLGMISKTNYYALWSGEQENPAKLESQGNEFKVTPVVGVGMNYFLTQSMALKLDSRMALFVDNVPDYEPNKDDENDDRKRLYNNFVASAGISVYFPRMPPRLTIY